jgi:hypothetical protein
MVLALMLVLMVAQTVFAGLFLDGHGVWRDVHSHMGMIVLPLIALGQVGLTVLAWRRGGSPGWVPLVSGLLLLAFIFQNVVGMGSQLWLHVPFVFVLVGLASALLFHALSLSRQ